MQPPWTLVRLIELLFSSKYFADGLNRICYVETEISGNKGYLGVNFEGSFHPFNMRISRKEKIYVCNF